MKRTILFLIISVLFLPEFGFSTPIQPNEVALVVNIYDSTDTDQNGTFDWQDVINYYAYIHPMWDSSNVIRVRTAAFKPRSEYWCTGNCRPLSHYYRMRWSSFHYDIDTVTSANYQNLTGLVDSAWSGTFHNKPANQDYVLQEIAQWFTDGNHWGEIKVLTFVTGMPMAMRPTSYYPYIRCNQSGAAVNKMVNHPLDDAVMYFLHPGVENDGGFTKHEPADTVGYGDPLGRPRLFFGRASSFSVNQIRSGILNSPETWDFNPGADYIINTAPQGSSGRSYWTADTMKIWVLTCRLDGMHVDDIRGMIQKAAWTDARYNPQTDSVEFNGVALIDNSRYSDVFLSDSFLNPWSANSSFRSSLIETFGYENVFHDSLGGSVNGPVYFIDQEMGCTGQPTPERPAVFYYSLATHNRLPGGALLNSHNIHYWLNGTLDFDIANGAITAPPESYSAQCIKDSIFELLCADTLNDCITIHFGGGTGRLVEALQAGFSFAFGHISEPLGSYCADFAYIPKGIGIPNNQFIKVVPGVVKKPLFVTVSLGDPLATWIDTTRPAPVTMDSRYEHHNGCCVDSVSLQCTTPMVDDLDSLRITVYLAGVPTVMYYDTVDINQSVTAYWTNHEACADSVEILTIDRSGNWGRTIYALSDTIAPQPDVDPDIIFIGSSAYCCIDSFLLHTVMPNCHDLDSLRITVYHHTAGVPNCSTAFAVYVESSDTIDFGMRIPNICIDSMVVTYSDISQNAFSISYSNQSISVCEDLSHIACGEIGSYKFQMIAHPDPYIEGVTITAQFTYRFVPYGQEPGEWITTEADRIDDSWPLRWVYLNLEEAGVGGYVEYIWWVVDMFNCLGTSPVDADTTDPANGPTNILYYDDVADIVMACDEHYAIDDFPETIDCDNRLVILPLPGVDNTWEIPEYTFDCSELAIVGTETLPITVTSNGYNLIIDEDAEIMAEHAVFSQSHGMLICSQTQKERSYLRYSSFLNSACSDASVMIVDGDIRIDDCVFTNSLGNGILIYDAEETEMSHCQIIASNQAGLIASYACDSVSIHCCTFADNGGADYPEVFDEGSNIMLDSASRNTFSDAGGSLYHLTGYPSSLKFYGGENAFILSTANGHYLSGACDWFEDPLDLSQNYWSQGASSQYFDPDPSCYIIGTELQTPQECDDELFMMTSASPPNIVIERPFAALKRQIDLATKSGAPQQAIIELEKFMISGCTTSDSIQAALDAAYVFLRNQDSDLGMQAAKLKTKSLPEFAHLVASSINEYWEIASVKAPPNANEALQPKSYCLYQNYPNPFNSMTEIRFDLPEDTRAELKVFNTLGQVVATLTDRFYSAGAQRFLWNGADQYNTPVPTGVYIYQIRAGNFVAAKKMILMR